MFGPPEAETIGLLIAEDCEVENSQPPFLVEGRALSVWTLEKFLYTKRATGFFSGIVDSAFVSLISFAFVYCFDAQYTHPCLFLGGLLCF